MFTFASRDGFAGRVTVEASIELQPTSENRYSFMLCEMGVCEPFGRPEGYDEMAFQNMNKACARSRLYAPIVSNAFNGLSFAALATSPTGVGVFVFFAGQSLASSTETPVDSQSIRQANDLMLPLISNKGDFAFQSTAFSALRDGLRYCHDYYETTPGVWLEDCDRSDSCRKNLAKNLDLSEKTFEEMSTLDLFILKQEMELACSRSTICQKSHE